MRAPTASQTIGPFWHPLADPALADLTSGAGEGVELVGRILDGTGAPVTDACVELWQAAAGRTAWGRAATDAAGGFAFRALAPDPIAPYLAAAIFARGLVKPLWTRVYFRDTADALLTALPEPRRITLLAQAEPPRWRWDVRLQGDGETVFLTF
jgi:protocatechuate 3,4-dioxygenase alpha subunit